MNYIVMYDRVTLAHEKLLGRTAFVMVSLLFMLFFGNSGSSMTHEIHPATVDSQEEFETLANSLKPGDELILHGGTYSQSERRSITAQGTPDKPIIIRAADGKESLLTHPTDSTRRFNNIEFVDCAHLIIRGLHFRGGSSGVRFIRGHHITFEDCEISQTTNNALTMNSGDCDAFIIRRNHIHHTGLSERGSTEGEGMYIGVHDGSHITTNTLVEGNYIHHLRGIGSGGNDGIEIKFGSHGNVVRNNAIHDTNLGRQYPGIFVYGGGPGTNVVEGNVIWHAGEGIQIVSDAVVRNNIIFDCSATGITAAPHAAVPQVRNAMIVHNTIFNAPIGVRFGWAKATNMVFANNAIYCAAGTAIRADGLGTALLRNNAVQGRLSGVALDSRQFFDGGTPAEAFIDPARHDFRPRPSSPLLGRADVRFAPPLDFNSTERSAPFDVGAYETTGQQRNPGWAIEAGFKR